MHVHLPLEHFMYKVHAEAAPVWSGQNPACGVPACGVTVTMFLPLSAERLCPRSSSDVNLLIICQLVLPWHGMYMSDQSSVSTIRDGLIVVEMTRQECRPLMEYLLVSP